jgi:hypothetical protein
MVLWRKLLLFQELPFPALLQGLQENSEVRSGNNPETASKIL